jgi:hypothetical protein
VQPDWGKVTQQSGPDSNTKGPFGEFFSVGPKTSTQQRALRLHPGTHIGEVFGGGIEIRPIRMLEQH